MEKVGNMQEQMNNVSRNTEILRILKEIKNAFDKFISRLNRAKERISKLEDTTIETQNLKSKEKKDEKKQNRISKNYSMSTKV